MSSQAIGNWRSIKLIISDKVQQIIDKGYLTEQDLQMSIHHGETKGEKLYQEGTNKLLSKTKYVPIIYVEYSPSDDGFVIHNALGHRSKII